MNLRILTALVTICATSSLLTSSEGAQVTPEEAQKRVAAYQNEHASEFDLAAEKQRLLSRGITKEQIVDTLAAITLDMKAIDALKVMSETKENEPLYEALSTLWIKRLYRERGLKIMHNIPLQDS